MKKSLKLFTLLFAVVFGLAACSQDDDMDGEGTVSLSITDAPIDEAGVSAVFVTITGIEYQMSGGSWEAFEEFEGPVTINLLDLQNGASELLGDFNAGAGTYTGLRFLLDAAVQNQNEISNPGCYITFEEAEDQPLFVPSGGQSGYKAIGDFTVPVNGTVGITADFDLRKSVTKAGASGKYLLNPTIRVIVNDQAGEIQGQIENRVEGATYIVYAYEAGTYTEEEAAAPAEGENRFPNAVTSTSVDAEGNYVLAFLAPTEYEIVVVEVTAEGENVVKEQESGVKVSSNTSLELNFSLDLGLLD
ncbi:DUF4382 domain-containing protein [Echinicola salinicaeni]|uniref:DUF4382 domain-containing protein n=1 Tax=Echinicola salinicaeni TaxID=2762757 RepID=UPI0016450766|nr:DUF4382 domain-containing protein [Echinicola salinicaeni]